MPLSIVLCGLEFLSSESNVLCISLQLQLLYIISLQVARCWLHLVEVIIL